MVKKITLLIFTLLIIISCGSNKNDNDNNTKNNTGTNQDPIMLPTEEGKLEGIIRDSKSSPIIGATIKIGNHKTTSNSAGFYSIPNIVQGRYTLFILKEGYTTKAHKVVISKTHALKNMVLFKNTKIPNIWADNSTNLMWQDEPHTLKEHTAYLNTTNHQKVGNWQYAKSYCTNLSLYDYNDWSLPNIEQLKDLYTKRSNLNNIAEAHYWSSLEGSDKLSNYAFYMNFWYDESLWVSKTSSAYVRCVRSK